MAHKYQRKPHYGENMTHYVLGGVDLLFVKKEEGNDHHMAPVRDSKSVETPTSVSTTKLLNYGFVLAQNWIITLFYHLI